MMHRFQSLAAPDTVDCPNCGEEIACDEVGEYRGTAMHWQCAVERRIADIEERLDKLAPPVMRSRR
jgi:hypothetical protein